MNMFICSFMFKCFLTLKGSFNNKVYRNKSINVTLKTASTGATYSILLTQLLVKALFIVVLREC